MPVKTAHLVARLYSGVQLVRTVPLTDGSAPMNFSMPNMTPPRLERLEFGDRLNVSRTMWRQIAWGNTDFIPLEDWVRDYGNVPNEEHVVGRERGHPLVVVRYVDYEHVKSF